jgi:cell division protein FtsL
MQPPEPVGISDSISVAASETTDISLAYGQYRAESVLTESSGLMPQDSISQQIYRNQGSEEERLRQEIAELERQQRIQDLQRRKEELLRNLQA